MSVLYSPTLRTRCTQNRSKHRKITHRFFLLFIIASFSIQGVVGQDDKEMQSRKEAELKMQEAAQLIEKLRSNPRLIQRLASNNSLKDLVEQLPTEEQNKISRMTEVDEKARYKAKMLEQEKAGPSLPGVEYKVNTNTQGQVEYVVTYRGSEIFRQPITASGSLYDRQVRAEREAIYASNTLRKDLSYPVDALKAEIRSLIEQPATNVSTARVSNNQRLTADYTFNGGGGTIPTTGSPGLANPYPSTIAVTGVPAGATVKEVTINSLNHTWSDDVDIVLQSPTGTNVILMSDAGGTGVIGNVNYTFNDGAAVSLADGSVSPSGTYKPSNYDPADNWPAPGPGSTPSSVTLSTFGNGDQNGTWSLFIVDDVGSDGGNWGTWSITFTDPPINCLPVNLTSQPVNATVCSGFNGSFTVTANNGVDFNWQVDMGSGFVYLTNSGIYSGVNSATLNITGATVAMNGYQYRVVVTCYMGGLPQISNPATLTVIASPNPPIVSPASAAICPGGNVQLTASQAGSGPPSTFSSGAIAVPVQDFVVNTSTINVAGFPVVPLAAISVNLNISHTWDSDVRVNLVAPNGQILNLINSRGGSGEDFTNTTISSASTTSLSTGTAPFTATFAADAASAVGLAPYLSNTTAWSNLYSVANGNWTLAVSDHGTGDVGTLTSWSITLTPAAVVNAVWTPVTGLFNDAALTSPYVAGTYQFSVFAAPASTTTYSASLTDGTCNSLPGTAIVTVNSLPALTGQPGSGNACVGVTKTLSVTATGSSLTYQWQVDMGAGFLNISTGSPTNPDGFIYTGQTTATLSINSVMETMNNFKYRCLVSGACPPGLTSNEVILVVNSRPVISVSSTSQCAPTTLTASGADTYSWTPSAGLSATTGATVTANPTANSIYTVTGTNTTTGCTNTAQVDVKFTPPTPVVAPVAPIICSGAVQQLSITSSSLPPVSNSTSSGAINVIIPDNEPNNGTTSSLAVSGVTGAVQSISVNFTIEHTWDADLDINLIAPNGNILNLVGARGGSGDNFTNTTISSTSTTSLGTGAPPFTGTFAADGLIGWGPANLASNVSTFASLFSVPNGTWRLAMADFGTGDVGRLTSWSITINYATPDAGIWTPVTGLFTNSAGTTPYVAGTPAATVYASPAATTTYSVSVTNTAGSHTRTFSSGGAATIPGVAPGNSPGGAGAPYPSSIAVSGLPANAVVKSVIAKGIRHSFPDDIDMLLKSPTGVDVVLMSDAGGGSDATGQNYTFDDAASSGLADASFNATGTYKPTNHGAADTYPAPIGSINQATPTLASFTGDPNGVWNLYLNDDAAGGVGMITSWEITFTIPDLVNCASTPRTVTVTVHTPITITTQPQNRTACQNSTVTFTVAAAGSVLTTQWQVSTNGGGAGGTWTDIQGATTTTLTLTNVQPSQNGYKYRLVLTNSGCGSVNSNEATLTVNALPAVSLSLSPSGQTQLRPGMLTTLSAVLPQGAAAIDSSFWYLNGVLVSTQKGATPTYVVDAFKLGTYTVTVKDINGCINTSSGVTFTALPSNNLFIYPNPTSGAYYVTYYFPTVGTPIILTVVDMKGRRIEQRQLTTSAPYTRFEFSNSNLAAGVYLIELRYAGGDRLASGQLVVLRD